MSRATSNHIQTLHVITFTCPYFSWKNRLYKHQNQQQQTCMYMYICISVCKGTKYIDKYWHIYIVYIHIYCTYRPRVSCQKGPTRHAYAWQIGPFCQDTLDIFYATIYIYTYMLPQHKHYYIAHTRRCNNSLCILHETHQDFSTRSRYLGHG